MADGSAAGSRVSVVTGAAGGIGVAVAQRLGSLGPVVLSDVRSDQLNAAVATARDQGLDATAVLCDVTDPAAVAALVDSARTLGPIGALVHGGGVSASMVDARAMLEINLLGTVRVIDAFAGHLGPGSVMVCVASMSGHRRRAAEFDDLLADPLAPGILDALVEASGGLSRPAYALAKRGVILLCERRSIALAKQGARIVSISPGVIDTEMGRLETGSGPDDPPRPLRNTPLGRLGDADEIASTVEFLVGPGAAYITGCDLLVDGGTIAAMRHDAPDRIRAQWDDPWPTAQLSR